MVTSPRLNRVDPFGDLRRVADRGMFTGNRGCLVDDSRQVVRHHRGNLWITCVLSYKDWRAPLDQPRHWTPLFFLDDAVALAAGHRPCGLCRPEDYTTYRRAVEHGTAAERRLTATDLNRMLASERLTRGRGPSRAKDRILWESDVSGLPYGTVLLSDDEEPLLSMRDFLLEFGFDGWAKPRPCPATERVRVLTPPTSVMALANGYRPVLHPTATA